MNQEIGPRVTDGPRVLVGVPCGTDYCQVYFMSCLGGIMRASAALAALDICIGQSSIVATARNNIVAEALKGDYTHIMFLDNDMVFPNNTVLRLLAAAKPIVGASYRRRRPKYEILGETLVSGPAKGLTEMRYLPTGVCLIETRVFRDLEMPWFRFAMDPARGYIVSEDYLFCIDARAKGYQIFCDVDLTMEVGHITNTVLMSSDEALGPGFGAVGIEASSLREKTFHAA